MTRRTPKEYNWKRLEFDETILTKHFTKGRLGSKIKFVVVHHMTIIGKGDGKANDVCYRVWQSRKASAHYGVDGGYVRQFVWDSNYAWATGNVVGNRSGVSIEHANLKAAPYWEVSPMTRATAARLAAHLHYVHGLGRPTSTKGGKGGTLRKHSSFKSTACPGPYMDSVWDQYVKDVQTQYDLIVSPKPVQPVAPPSSTQTPVRRYRVTSPSLNGRSGPGMSYPVKAVRKKGFQFNSKKQVGNWVQASKYWYHLGHLELVNTSRPVDIRLGTLNIPLDDAKIPGGKARVKEAAKRIKASNLHLIAVQEMDRAPRGTGHQYANWLLNALGSEWRMVKPTTNFNENYIFYKSGKSTFVRQLPDLILRSNAGGRHSTRAVFKIGGKEFTFHSTHLVSGSKNGHAREEQGEQLAATLSKSHIVMGDLNQKAVPRALAKTHKSARTSALSAQGETWGTYSKWTNKKASKADSAFLDHILVPKQAVVRGYSLLGLDIRTGLLHQPRLSDHMLVIAAITI